MTPAYLPRGPLAEALSLPRFRLRTFIQLRAHAQTRRRVAPLTSRSPKRPGVANLSPLRGVPPRLTAGAAVSPPDATASATHLTNGSCCHDYAI